MKKPHMIMLVADQYRMDSIGYGGCHAAVTPNFDRLAEEGIGFNNAFCQNTVCVPSRISFLSGLYPHVNGHRTMHHLADQNYPNLLRNMKDNGYQVYWGGRNDFLRGDVPSSLVCDVRNNRYETFFKVMRGKIDPSELDMDTRAVVDYRKQVHREKLAMPERYKYSHYYGVGDRAFSDLSDIKEIEDAIQYIENYDEDKPLMMYLAVTLPHPPYQVDRKYYDMIDPEKILDPIRLTQDQRYRKPAMFNGIRDNQGLYEMSDDELKEIKRVYLAMGTKLDDAFGKLMATLKEKGMYDDSFIFMFSDHGDYTGDYEIAEKSQNTYEDMLTNVPLIVKPNFKVDHKNGENALIELIDIQATIYEVAGIKPGHTHFGKSLMPVLKGSNTHREYVFTEGGRMEGEKHCTDSGHNIDNEYWARTAVQDEIPGHTKAIMVRDEKFKYISRHYEMDEFYALTDDPNEVNNLIDDENYKEQIIKMKDTLLNFYMSTCDVVPHRRDDRVERSH